MVDDQKPTENQNPPAEEPKESDKSAGVAQSPAQPDHAQKIADLEKQLKDRDAQISDLSTTVATIEERHRQTQQRPTVKDDELDERLNRLTENMLSDPKEAAKELKNIISEVRTGAVNQARQAISAETVVEKLKLGVRASNPDFDDDIVDVVMQRANEFAQTGKFKTAQEAVDAATNFVKSKFDSYANKRNAAPPMPPGAHAEGGGANVPQKAPEPPRVKSALEELEEHNESRYRKTL